MSQAWIDDLADDAQRVDVLRARLDNLGWFRNALKEPLAWGANNEDNCTGTFSPSRSGQRFQRLLATARLPGS